MPRMMLKLACLLAAFWPVAADAQALSDRLAIARVAAAFARDTYELPMHFRTTEAIIPVAHHLGRNSDESIGPNRHVMECQQQNGPDPCRWLGSGLHGGIIIDISSIDVSESNRATVELTVVRLQSHYSRVEFNQWRLEMRRVNRDWELAAAKATGGT